MSTFWVKSKSKYTYDCAYMYIFIYMYAQKYMHICVYICSICLNIDTIEKPGNNKMDTMGV